VAHATKTKIRRTGVEHNGGQERLASKGHTYQVTFLEPRSVVRAQVTRVQLFAAWFYHFLAV